METFFKGRNQITRNPSFKKIDMLKFSNFLHCLNLSIEKSASHFYKEITIENNFLFSKKNKDILRIKGLNIWIPLYK